MPLGSVQLPDAPLPAPGFTALRSKMAVCQANGARLGWLLIPHEQAVEVWPASGDPQRFEGRGTPAEASAP